MKIRHRITAGLLPVVIVGFSLLVRWIVDEIRPQTLRAMEVVLIDLSQLLAATLEQDALDGRLETAGIRAVMEGVRSRNFSARVYEFIQTGVVLRVYITDEKGLVVFDSDRGLAEGKDYSRWNDVYLTLRGRYGARSTRSEPENPHSSVLYVAAPVKIRGRLAGVVSVGKPAASVKAFIENSTRNVLTAGLIAALLVMAASYLMAGWITRPVKRLTGYALALKDGLPGRRPGAGRSEVGDLVRAFEAMRQALDGKQYVEQYVQTVTHGLKGPLSSIAGAAELLDEDLPPEDRRRFTGHIRQESARMRRMVDRLLELARLEIQAAPPALVSLDLGQTVREAAAAWQTRAELAGVRVELSLPPATPIHGDAALLQEVVENLLQNALDFSPPAGTIKISLERDFQYARLAVEDEGNGVPDFAADRVFEKFYSHRPAGQPKGAGLGLAIVAEIARLHGGRARLLNRPEGGARAELELPLSGR